MRKALLVIYLLNIILVLVSLAVLPDRVATHFGRGGLADSWMSKTTHAAIFILIELPLFVLFYWSGSLLDSFNPKFVNLPNRDYWLSGANLPRAKVLFGDLMARFGVVVFLFLLIVDALVLEANFRDPVRLNETFFLPAFLAFMAYTVFWCVQLVRAFRVEKA
jgi:uncharacterized membrane protein